MEINNAADFCKKGLDIPSQFTKDATSSPFYTVGDIAGSIAAAPIDTGNRPISGLIDNVASIFSGE